MKNKLLLLHGALWIAVGLAFLFDIEVLPSLSYVSLLFVGMLMIFLGIITFVQYYNETYFGEEKP